MKVSQTKQGDTTMYFSEFRSPGYYASIVDAMSDYQQSSSKP
jgi:hypothetical protein